ncbi:MAG: NifU family protein [Bacteroidetes bacterium]|nr:NifU family protein [Bacteroidota bacterium]MBL0017327.1 NifU family protein [Bacteroidota bacterium]MBP6640548.1 NifU family protein [Bacteroidia bacterium]MBP8074099.1 NifU family protein [Bacteroidia bacterium]
MIYTEITPNPATLKFVTQKILLRQGSADFEDPTAAGQSPLAKQVFELAFVKAVFISGNFVSVTKASDTTWETAIPPIKKAIAAFLETGKPAIEGLEDGDENEVLEEDETVMRIKQLLNDNIRPAVAMDGGDVIFESFVDGVVKLKMQGACSGCPSSTMTLKMGIEGLLTRMVPGVKEVVSV